MECIPHTRSRLKCEGFQEEKPRSSPGGQKPPPRRPQVRPPLLSTLHACPTAQMAGGEEGPRGGLASSSREPREHGWRRVAVGWLWKRGVNLPGWGKGHSRQEHGEVKYHGAFRKGGGACGGVRGPGSARGWAQRLEPTALSLWSISW